MIDLVHKLPDSAIGLLAAGAVWFGFNYMVLGERAMERYAASDIMPACVASLGQHSTPRAPKLHLGKLLGMPELDDLEDQIVERATPPAVSQAAAIANCECAVAASSQSLRLDFAIATASFRYFSPESVANFRQHTVALLSNGGCASPNT